MPDFLIVGAPKAGSTALHAALVGHPDLFLSTPKEPKFFLTDGRRPYRDGQRGPGDAHSAQEWIWRRRDYEALFAGAPPGSKKGESTPFYLWSTAAQRRIRAAVPDVRMIAVVRDPVERAYSNWSHLWADGLEPEGDFLTAWRLAPARAAAGWAPFWRYDELGRYGEQLAHLTSVFPREQVHVLRYREVLDEPRRTLDAICRFLGVREGMLEGIPSSNVGRWAGNSVRTRRLRHAVRTGAALGAHLPPAAWRRVERPLLAQLQRDGGRRPRIDPAARRELLEYYRDDVALLETITGDSYRDWFGDGGTDVYRVQRPA